MARSRKKGPMWIRSCSEDRRYERRNSEEGHEDLVPQIDDRSRHDWPYDRGAQRTILYPSTSAKIWSDISLANSPQPASSEDTRSGAFLKGSVRR